MAAFKIHEDQENVSLGVRKENVEIFTTVTQRRALGDLSHFTCNQNGANKITKLTNGPVKVQDENRSSRQINNEKNIVPPVAQFRAFSVYEDEPLDAELKKRETVFKPFVSKETRKENVFNVNEDAKTFKSIQDKQQIDCPKDSQGRLPLLDKKPVVESPMSLVDSSILSMSISRNESQLLQDDDEEDAVEARTDKEEFFRVEEYREEIYDYMKEIEVKHRANPRYMRKQPDITHSMRSILVDWLVEVCDEYSQQNETLHLAVSYVDRFLSYMSVVRTKLQLVGTAATYIAAKFEEVYPPEVAEFVYITDDTYTKKEVLRMEHLILKVLSFDLSTPTSLAFISLYCITTGLSKKIFNLASYIAELTLLEADPYLHYKTSVIAASALATARHCLLCRQHGPDASPAQLAQCAAAAWPESLALVSGYEFADLEPCLREVARTHSHASLQIYQAIPDKYKSNKFDEVSSIEPRPMFPVAEYQPPPQPTTKTTETARAS